MSTESTAGITKQLVARLLDAAPEPLTGGGTVRELLSDRVYVRRPPDSVVYPFAVVNLALRTDPNFDNSRMTGSFECTVFARPLTRAEQCEEIADRIMQAFAGYKSAVQGLTFVSGLQRDALPAFHDPADSDVTAIRVVAQVVVWPLLLIGGMPAQ